MSGFVGCRRSREERSPDKECADFCFLRRDMLTEGEGMFMVFVSSRDRRGANNCPMGGGEL